MSIRPNREQAWALLCEFNESEALRGHALMVEAVMRHFAETAGEDPDKWGVIGLLHDLDYEKYPDEHCAKSAELLSGRDIDPEYVRAVVSHGWGLCSDVKPEQYMEKVLYATDELTGLIHATAIMRPSRSVLDLELKSVQKKFKDKRFAAGVNREVIRQGAEMLGTTVDDLIGQCIEAMRKAADAIGLRGNLD